MRRPSSSAVLLSMLAGIGIALVLGIAVAWHDRDSSCSRARPPHPRSCHQRPARRHASLALSDVIEQGRSLLGRGTSKKSRLIALRVEPICSILGAASGERIALRHRLRRQSADRRCCWPSPISSAAAGTPLLAAQAEIYADGRLRSSARRQRAVARSSSRARRPIRGIPCPSLADAEVLVSHMRPPASSSRASATVVQSRSRPVQRRGWFDHVRSRLRRARAGSASSIHAPAQLDPSESAGRRSVFWPVGRRRDGRLCPASSSPARASAPAARRSHGCGMPCTRARSPCSVPAAGAASTTAA